LVKQSLPTESRNQLFISSKNESVRMFENNILDYLSRVRPWVPLAIYTPIILGCIVWYFIHFPKVWPGLGIFFLGVFFWSFFEYSLHRWFFHFKSNSNIGKRIHFIIHGIHHAYPNDHLRLVMPPGFSLPLAVLIFGLSLIFWRNNTPIFFAGFASGYLLYDCLHYAVHHFNFRNPLFQKLKKHHMMHHFRDPESAFGFTSSIWDKVFGTDIKN